MSYAGRENAIYVNTGTTWASPTWVYLDRIFNVKLPKSKPASERKWRGANSTKSISGYKSYIINCMYERKKAGGVHAVFDKLSDSYYNNTPLDIIAVNAKLFYPAGHPLITKNAVGIRGYFEVFKLDEDQSDEDGTTYDLELREVYEEVSGVMQEVIPFSQAIAAAA